MHVEGVEADCGCAVGIPGEGGMNRDGKIIRRRMFEHEPGCPCAEGRSCHPLIAASSDQDDLRLRRGVLDVAARIYSIHLRHRQVGDDDVRGECAGGVEKSAAVSHAADDVVRGLKQAFPRRQQTGVIVCEEHARSRVWGHQMPIIVLMFRRVTGMPTVCRG